MDPYHRLVEVLDRLFGPRGCSWDKKQTLDSMEAFLQEELYELIEAMDDKDQEKMKEEGGDLFWGVLFFAKLAERAHLFNRDEMIEVVCQKIIKRHPHVFGKKKIAHDEIEKQWEEIKKGEKAHQQRKSLLDGIPPKLPLLLKAQKMAKKIRKTSFIPKEKALSKEEIKKELVKLVFSSEESGFLAEKLFRDALGELEGNFREWEKKHIGCFR